MLKSVIQLPRAKLHFNKPLKQKVLLKAIKGCLKMQAAPHIKHIDFSNSLKADWRINFCSLKQNITK